MDFRDSSMRTVGNAAHSIQIPQPSHHRPHQQQQPGMINDSQINSMNGPWTIHVDNTHTLPPLPPPPPAPAPPSSLPPSFALGSAFNISNDNSPQNRMLNDILAPLLHHNEIANYRDIVSTYLKLPANLWRSLRALRESTFAHEVLRDNLPSSLWHLIMNIREDVHFDPLQPFTVAMFAEQTSFMVPSHSHSRSASGGAGRPALHPSHATSPGSGGFQFSSPVGGGQDHSMQTRSVTPVSIVYSSSRNNSRSPWRNRKGKAPPGQLYVCPSSNCTKKGFKNVGNYINHMLRLHAEYPRHDPETSLRPESSPPIDNGEEFVSPSATTGSNSPLYVRHLSQDWGNFGDLHLNFGHDDFHQPPGHSAGNSGSGGNNTERFDLSSSFTSDSGGAGSMHQQDNFGTVEDRPESAHGASHELSTDDDDDAEDSANDHGGNLSFGMFQATIMSARRSSRNRMLQ